MSDERPDPRIPEDPAVPGTKRPEEVPPGSGPVEPPPPDGSERPAAPEDPDQEGQRRFKR